MRRRTIFNKKKVDWIKYFKIPKVIEFFRGEIPLNALAVYPVFCSQADLYKNKQFHVSMQEIAKLSGLKKTETVSKAVESLNCKEFRPGDNKSITLLKVKKDKSQGRPRNFYKVGFVRSLMNKQKIFQDSSYKFLAGIVTSGIWAKLSPRAKALYMAMREFSKPDLPWRAEYGFLTCTDSGFADKHEAYNNKLEEYKNRQFDLCTNSLTFLCNAVGMSSSNIGRTALSELEEAHLVKRIEDEKYRFMVFIKPY